MSNDTTKIRFNDGVSKVMDLNPCESSARLISPGTTRWGLPGDMMVYSFNATSLQHGWSRPAALVRQENVQMVTVRMASGTSFSVGLDQRLLAYSAGKIMLVDPIRSKRLCLPVIRTFGRCFPVEKEVLAYGNQGRAKSLQRHTMPLNGRTGLWLGLVLGDGCVTQAGQVFLYGNGWKTKSRRVFAAISSCGDFPYSGVTGTVRFESQGLGRVATIRTRTLIASERWFSLWLKDQIGHDALSKQIPDFCLNASDDHLWGLFDGLISSDGSVSISRAKARPQLMVSFSTSSRRLVEGFQKLCERLTLRCSVSPYRSQHSGLPAFIINVSTRDLAKAHDRHPVTFVNPGKNAFFRRWIGHVAVEGPGVTGNQVPYPAELDRAFKRTYAWDNKFEKLPCGKTYFGPFASFKYKGRWDRGTALRYVEALGRFKKWPKASPQYLAILRDESIAWDKVIEVRPISHAGTAWSIVVPGADGIALDSGLLIPTFRQSSSAISQ